MLSRASSTRGNERTQGFDAVVGGHEHDDRHEEGDDHRREEPPARGNVQGDPAPHDAPDQTEHQIANQPVYEPSLLAPA